ncbi:major tail protein [Gordonia phage Catfish]|uniref:Major tail protein n=1 Tax=Gordonia phage Catfish TaxID=2301538 RepID=A0A385D0I2_9CAUD|nr:major tail protein [Gordonia phage Catfish]AXQ51853.1 major tail protein [Gordonia phage Catfish]
MAYDDDAARLGVTGALRMGPVGSTFATGMGPWAAPFVDLGYISGDGITESLDEDKEEFIPWQRQGPIRVEVTKSTKTFQAVLWESNFHTVSLYYRKQAEDFTVTPGANGALDVVEFTEGEDGGRDVRAFGIDVVDGVYARRIEIPFGEVTERGDIVYQRNSIIAYEVTITAFAGPDGVSVKRKFREGWTVPAGN